MMKLDKKVKVLMIVIISMALISGIFVYINKENQYKETSYKIFLEYVNKNMVERVDLSDEPRITGKLKNGEYFITDNPRTENFKEYLLKNNIKVIETNGSLVTLQSVFFFLVIGAVGVAAYFMNNNASKQAQKEIEIMSDMEDIENNSNVVTFADVAGNEEAKESLNELVDFLKNPEKYGRYGARMPRGVLLYGPPGTGKTLLAKALAGEAKVPFFAVSGSDFIQVYAGLGASRIRSLFSKAKQKGKSVVFIDEIDALGKKRRGNVGGGSEESDRTLNALLTEMSGFRENEGIIVVAATNRIDTLDEALLRPGRFDRQIEVGLPDINARYRILKLHGEKKPLAPDVDLKKVAQETVYFSGAKLENLMNESAMMAARENEDFITMNHINRAYYTVLVGEEKKDRSCISAKDKEITAYHEAGHALVTKMVSTLNRVTKVSIIPSTKGMGGFSMNIPPNRMYQRKRDIVDNIMIALGGRAAEEIIFGKENITTGASNDLKKATEMTLSMVGSFGMDEEAGLINYEVLLENKIGNNDELVKRAGKLIDGFYEETMDIVTKNIDRLQKLAAELLEKEMLEEKEINEIILQD